MKQIKYKIEGNIDFYAELNKPFVEESKVETNADENVNVCLITRFPLTDDFVKMECGHRFNYLPLYNELVQQTKPSICGYTKGGRIVCPYCRHSQQTLLPFHFDFKPVLGVNLYPIKLCNNIAFEKSSSGSCHLESLSLCTSDYTYNLFGDKHFCEGHKMIGLSIAKQSEFHEAFLKKSNIIELKLQKQKEMKEKKEMLKSAKAANKTQNANKTTVGCSALLKTGPKKGQPCGCSKLVTGTTVCLRHLSNEST